MKQVLPVLKQCILFKNLSQEEIEKIINSNTFKLSSYDKGDVIAIEGDDCNSIGIVIKGKVEISRIFASGKTVTMDRLTASRIFGEAIIFSNLHTYPATITVAEKGEILFISKGELLKICSENNIVLNSFMSLLSNKILMLNKKVKVLSYKNIRQRIASFILEEYRKQKNLHIKLKVNRKEMSEELGIPRPSLSREMMNMKDEGIIDYDKSSITINDLEILEECLVE